MTINGQLGEILVTVSRHRFLAWIENGRQTDFYDVPEYVNTAAARANAWFQETL